MNYDCNRCQDKALVGGFLPGPCPECRAADADPHVADLCSALVAERQQSKELRARLEACEKREEERRRHPMAPGRCPVCQWTNINLMNYGTEDGKPKWLCHGCAASALAKLSAAEQARDEAVREVLVLRHLVKRIDETLRVPAAEYVPAISDVFTLIDALGSKGPR